jgi:hypothetical protein
MFSSAEYLATIFDRHVEIKVRSEFRIFIVDTIGEAR